MTEELLKKILTGKKATPAEYIEVIQYQDRLIKELKKDLNALAWAVAKGVEE